MNSKDPSGEEYATGVAVDAAGGVIVGGQFTGAINFGKLETSAGLDDIFLTKLDKDGKHVFTKTFGGVASEQLRALATDSMGNIVLVGMFAGTLTFGGPFLVSPGSSPTLFFAKLAPNGDHIMSYAVGDEQEEQVYGLALDAADNIYLAGQFKGVMDFETASGGLSTPTPLTATDGYDIFLAKLDKDGKHVFSYSFGTIGDQQAWGVAVSATGKIALAGTYTGNVDFGGGTLSNTNIDAVVAMFDAAGAHVFTKDFGGALVQEARAVAFDPLGDLVVGGDFFGSIAIGGKLYTANAADDGFVMKLSGITGNPKYVVTFGDAALQRVVSVSVDSKGHAYVVGTSAGSVHVGGALLKAPEGEAALVFKLDDLGNAKWAGLYGGTTLANGKDCALDANGDLFVVGDFTGDIDFGKGKLTTQTLDAVVAKFPGSPP
ncbi:MAG: hypothetical protein EXR75_05205 [Myxococcales bacterium]|nr:hypothetical protein [Myxococcales bacterium]